MTAARAAGGHGKRRTARVEKLVPGTLRPVLATLLDVLGEARDGSLPAAQANAVATVAGAIVKVWQAGVVEDRLAELEGQIAALTRRQA